MAERAVAARGFLEKLSGLIVREPLREKEAFVIASPLPWVHTFFMKYPLDLVFLDRDNQVVGVESLGPWRVSKIYLKANKVLELVAGAVDRSRTRIGDPIEFS